MVLVARSSLQISPGFIAASQRRLCLAGASGPYQQKQERAFRILISKL